MTKINMYIPCKYKYFDENKEKFEGKPYCVCFNELCEDISFACDKNCQIYDDWIQSQRLKQENERLKKELRLYDCIKNWGTKECRCACRCLGNEFCKDADKKINKYRSALEEIRDTLNKIYNVCDDDCGNASEITKVVDRINEVLND